MKIAIHHRPGSFSDRWIEYCEKNKIEYKIVCAYDTNIIEQVQDCDAFMWHHHHADYKDVLFSKQLIFSLETAGIRCFPNAQTTWHFDDKLGQKYLLEAIGAPLVPSYVFYTKKEAFQWIKKTSFPIVFKLRGGAGSNNVKLVKNERAAVYFVKKAFSRGFSCNSIWTSIKEVLRKRKEKRVTFYQSVVTIFRIAFMPNSNTKLNNREKGYVYFQEFIPNNSYDIRICVVGNKAFGLIRLTRKNDFRASGSGHIVYEKNQIDTRCVEIAFKVSQQLKTQSLAFDFVFDKNNNPLIVEISYGYSMKAYDMCEGFWDKDLNWHAGQNFDFCGWMVEEVMNMD